MTSLIRNADINRRRLLATGAAAGVLAMPMAACAADAPSEAVEVQIAEGRLRGARTGGVDAYKGVPYGASVSGMNRFKPASPVAPWTGPVMGPTRQSPPPEYTLKAGEPLSVPWRTPGRRPPTPRSSRTTRR